ncbi:MAG: YihY/virulence factor BrkB family protein [Arthrospira sp. SH-MAG29]|nr:YihY/virulence factor BrkB family protein [Arthrospira sp. SH-MAG29]MBS0018372.1 YihY/virulence factor BrkB family protein [Arthrospira sp. SH-MAG29]
MNLATAKSLFKETITEWQKDKVPILAAALAYYMVFSLAPLLMIVIAVAGLIVGEAVAQQEVLDQLEKLMGEQGASVIANAIQSQFHPSSSIITTIIGVVTLLFAATTIFAQLKESLNIIWHVEVIPGQGIWEFIRSRILSIIMVLLVGLLLLSSLAISSFLAGMSDWLDQVVSIPRLLRSLIDNGVSFILITILFGQIYRILPDVKIAWSDVAVGSGITAILFIIGRTFISFYLGRATVASAYGAASSFVVLLLWIFYSCQIFLLGAELTKIWSRRFGNQIRPSSNAVMTKNYHP